MKKVIGLVNAPIRGMRFTKYPNDLASAQQGLKSRGELEAQAFADFTRPGALHLIGTQSAATN